MEWFHLCVSAGGRSWCTSTTDHGDKVDVISICADFTLIFSDVFGNLCQTQVPGQLITQVMSSCKLVPVTVVASPSSVVIHIGRQSPRPKQPNNPTQPNQQPTTNNQQPTTTNNNQHQPTPTHSNQQLPTNNQQQPTTTNNNQQKPPTTTNNKQQHQRAYHCKLRRIGWEMCVMDLLPGLETRPRRGSWMSCCFFSGTPPKSATGLLEGTLPLRYCVLIGLLVGILLGAYLLGWSCCWP